MADLYAVPLQGGGVIYVNANSPADAVTNAGSQAAGGASFAAVAGSETSPSNPYSTAPAASTSAGGGGLGDKLQADNELAREKWEMEKQRALQVMQLATTADQRAAALVQLQQAQVELQKLQFAETQRQFDTNTREGQRSQYSNLATNLLSSMQRVQGPRDWWKYAQTMGGGRNVLEALYGSEGMSKQAAAVDPSTNQPKTLWDMLQGLLGGAPGQGAPLQQMQAAGAGTVGSGTMIPRPHQINPAVWDSLSDTARELVRGSAEAGMTESGYFTAEDFENQINQTRPMGTAPRQTRTAYQAPSGLF